MDICYLDCLNNICYLKGAVMATRAVMPDHGDDSRRARHLDLHSGPT